MAEFAVNFGAVATPLALVVTVAVPPVPGAANVPLAPLAGAVNVTEAPLIGFPPLSVTVTARLVPYAVVTAALCGVVPGTTVMIAAGPAVLLSEKAAGVETPATVALTV
jgi:hypothetical protein